MKRLILWTLCLLLCFQAGGGIASSFENMDEATRTELDEAFGTIFKKYKTVGAVLLVARDDDLLYQRNFGYANKRGRELVTDDTYFLLASVTKFVTGMHVMQLVEKGLLELDRDISDYLGYRVRNPYYPDTPLTLRMLMTHTSSLNATRGYTKDGKKLSDLISSANKVRGNFYQEEPGSVYRYSNFGAGIMGSLIESVTGLNVNDSITESLFTPLGIDAAYSARLLGNPDDISYLYTAGAEHTFQARSKSLKAPWGTGVNPEKHFKITVGSLWMRARDLWKLVRMMCGGGSLDDRRILREETVQEMTSRQQGRNGIAADTPYGLCVHHETTLLDGVTLYGHQGIIESILCNVYYNPEDGFIFIMLTNGCNSRMENHVAMVTRKAFALAWENFGK